MKAAEVLRLYEAGRRDFKGVSLRGQSFKGKDLSGADFSEADIRSTNFTNANLTEVNFSEAKAGLQRRWAAGLVVASLLLYGVLCFSTGALYIYISFLSPINLLALIASVAIIFLFLRKGIGLSTLALTMAPTVFLIALSSRVGAELFGNLFLSIFLVFATFSTTFSFMVVCAFAVSFAIVETASMAMLTVLTVTAVAIGIGIVLALVTTSEPDSIFRLYSSLVGVIATVFFVRVSAYIARRALKGDIRDSWIRSIALALSATGGTSFRGATLTDADFSQSLLKSTDFRRAVLMRTRWRDAEKLDRIRPGESYLDNPKIRELVITGNDQGQSYDHLLNLEGINLQGANLVKADFTGSTLKTGTLQGATLTNTYFIGADLNRVNLQGVDLSNAQLNQTQLDQADLTGATLTGACIEDWNVNSSTKLADITCDYVYLKSNQQERRPSQGTFQPGEFTALFQQAVNTVDLIFKDGIDWQAFFQSFQALRTQYAEQDLSIQAIEKKKDGAFVVRLEVPEDADKPAIESSAKELYETKLALMEQRYRAELNAKDGEIVAYREQSANLMKITELLAARPPMSETPKYDLRNAQFSGGFAETVQGDQIGGTINNQSAETPSLAEAAAEIQALLKPLEASNPTATEAEQTAYLSAMILPTKRERFIGALKSAGGAAIEEVPYGPVLKALVEGWHKPNG
ncbi:pentapeptide repeat-containing protein [Leptothoe kymatousa]|uniref:Pentapeptide repeat-containing protein n=1 Tax=Leptothoe kymatousa TAU-MAC 1615 TaxID=2364775 RepID=A0ABS5Y3X6_9CYAN|nr:pentapeptide repeat-containing protein [Leptothoe kymatousa]MBT9312549.1 pentapeptide repeat-containing protein [Leptothoe kymatousa TAU-MAC 1615]